MAATNDIFETGTFVGRVWRPDVAGPSLVVLRGGDLYDITSKEVPTMRDLLERDDPVAFLLQQEGEHLASLEAVMGNSVEAAGDLSTMHLLAPCDLQAVKACGVTFARSMLERVIEEKAAGNPALAEKMRERVTAIIGDSLRDLKAGSPEAAKVKAALIDEGVWSQYLEVGIGPDAEVFSKAQVLASVGWGASVGLHPISRWNNPEPEIVLAVDSQGRVKGATLGNDVNLRDVEGRSALLLGKAKDNNASSAIGPFVRLFDASYSIDDVRNADLSLTISGPDGFSLKGSSTMREISRDPLDLVSADDRPPSSISGWSCAVSWERCLRPLKIATRRVRASPTSSAMSSPSRMPISAHCSQYRAPCDGMPAMGIRPVGFDAQSCSQGITLIQSATAAKARFRVLAFAAFSLSTSGVGSADATLRKR